MEEGTLNIKNTSLNKILDLPYNDKIMNSKKNIDLNHPLKFLINEKKKNNEDLHIEDKEMNNYYKNKIINEINKDNFNQEINKSLNNLKFDIFYLKENKSNNNSPKDSLLKLEKINNDALFSWRDKNIIDKFSKHIFKIKDYTFLKKKKKSKTNDIKIIDNHKDIKYNLKDMEEIKKHEYKLIRKNINYNYKHYNKLKIFEISREEKAEEEINKKNLSLISNKNNIPDINTNKLNNIKLIKISKEKKSHIEKQNQNKFDNLEAGDIKYFNYLKNKQNIKLKWTMDEDKKLIKIKEDFPYLTWQQISQFFENRSKIDCMNRYIKVIDPRLKKGKWSEEEDKILIEWSFENGEKNWPNLIKSNKLKGRNCKQIRERWVNNLCPKLKKQFWDEKNEKILIEKFLIYGTSWTKISSCIPDSSENIVKNKFYGLLRKTANKYTNLNNISQNKNKLNISNSDIKSDGKDDDFLFINNTDLIQKIKNKNTRNNIVIKKDLTDIYLKIDENDNSNTKANTIIHNSFFLENSDNNLFIDNENTNKPVNKKRKKNNFSLDILLNYLPYLLKERGIDYEKIISQIDKNFGESNDKNNKDSRNNKKKVKMSKNKYDFTDEKIKLKSKIDFLNAVRKPFERNKEVIRKELINKIKIISKNNMNIKTINDKNYNFINYQNDLCEKNSIWENESFLINTYNNINNNNFGGINSKLQCLFLTNNNFDSSNNNDSFVSNENEILNIFGSNKINLNFSNSDFYNKNLSNSINFSDLLDVDNNNNILNNSNISSFNNSENNFLDLNLSANKNNNNNEKKNTNDITIGVNRMKSSIMLNLQLNLLNKIIEKIKYNCIQKFFKNFKNNTLFKIPNTINTKNGII